MRLKASKLLAAARGWNEVQKQVAAKLAARRNQAASTALLRAEPNAAKPELPAEESQKLSCADLETRLRARAQADMEKNDPALQALIDNLNRNAIKSAIEQRDSRRKPAEG